jgi:hypothetical protein
MTQALYAHMNNKTIKQKQKKICVSSGSWGRLNSIGPIWSFFTAGIFASACLRGFSTTLPG